jgi:hypothetical protein
MRNRQTQAIAADATDVPCLQPALAPMLATLERRRVPVSTLHKFALAACAVLLPNPLTEN